MQSFTACLQTAATSTFRLGEDAGVHVNSVIYTVSIPSVPSVCYHRNVAKMNDIDLHFWPIIT